MMPNANCRLEMFLTLCVLVKSRITVTGRKTNNEKRKRMLENGDNEAQLRSSSNSVQGLLDLDGRNSQKYLHQT